MNREGDRSRSLERLADRLSDLRSEGFPVFSPEEKQALLGEAIPAMLRRELLTPAR